MYNALLVPSFVSHSSLLTAKGVDLAVARDDGVLFMGATLIAEVLFEQFLIRNAV